MGAFLFARPPVDVNTTNVYEVTHPPQLARLNYIMEGAISWCNQNRPALAGGLRWQDQIAFLESEAGREYVRRIGENLKTYVAAL